jgi:DNA-binding response OmpR family regulator
VATAANLVLLDLTLPDRYGPTVCSVIRASSSVPIVAVGSSREQQLVGALSAGADVFVSKLTSDRELVARVRALLRRVPATGDCVSVWMPAVGPVQLNRSTRQVRCNGTSIGTTRREFDLLERLMLRPDCVVSRAELQRSIWGARRDPQALDVHVRRLRAKLEAHDTTRRIRTVRGVGFVFVGNQPSVVAPDATVLDMRVRAPAADAPDRVGLVSSAVM